jgi:hypothetical protein
LILVKTGLFEFIKEKHEVSLKIKKNDKDYRGELGKVNNTRWRKGVQKTVKLSDFSPFNVMFEPACGSAHGSICEDR